MTLPQAERASGWRASLTADEVEMLRTRWMVIILVALAGCLSTAGNYQPPNCAMRRSEELTSELGHPWPEGATPCVLPVLFHVVGQRLADVLPEMQAAGGIERRFGLPLDPSFGQSGLDI